MRKIKSRKTKHITSVILFIFQHCPRFPYIHKEGRRRDKTPRYNFGVTNATLVKLYILICIK